MPVSFNIPELFEENGVDSLDMAGLKSWFTPKLNPVKMAYIGLRAVDPEEKLLLEKLNIPTYTMQEVDDLGIREVNISRIFDRRVYTTKIYLIKSYAGSRVFVVTSVANFLME